MRATVDYLIENFRGIGATAKLDPRCLSSLKINNTPLNHLALVTTVNNLLKIQPYDRHHLSPIYEAIIASKLGLSPEKTKDTILIKTPQLTGDRRQELIKVVKELAETQRTAIRNIRRDARKAFPKDHKQIEELTTSFIKEIDDLLAHKIEKLKGTQFKFS